MVNTDSVNTDSVNPDSAVSHSVAADSRIAGQLRRFAAAHGSPDSAVISYLGRGRTRIVVVGGDGMFADAVVPSVEVANLTCAEAGIEVKGWEREVTARITPSAKDRRRMAGTGR